MAIRPIVCEFDAASKIPGTSLNGALWKELLSGVTAVEEPVFLNRRLGEHLPTLLKAIVLQVLDSGERPLVLGGDHRLTHAVLGAFRHRFERLTVHHFDAHHDAHRAATVNNYSFFYHMRHWPIRTVRYGVREADGDAIGRVDVDPGGPSYVTVDIDYLDPSLMSAVSFPMGGDEARRFTPESLISTLRSLRSEEVVGADLMEWCGPQATTPETDRVRAVLLATIETLDRNEGEGDGLQR